MKLIFSSYFKTYYISDLKMEEILKAVIKITELLPASATLSPEQYQALECFINHRDCLLMMPTGGGKSFVYQVTPYIKHLQHNHTLNNLHDIDYSTIIISPLNSIMKDQVRFLCEKGIPSCYLDMKAIQGHTFMLKSDVNDTSDSDSGDNMENDDGNEDDLLEVKINMSTVKNYTLIYSHPEALLSTTLGKELLKKVSARVCCIAIDEAHMVCEW